MNPTAVTAAVAVGVATSGAMRLAYPPTPRVAARVRPYTLVTRSLLGLAPDGTGSGTATGVSGHGAVGGVLLDPLRASAARLSRIVESRTDDAIALRLYQAGRVDLSPDDYRVRQIARGAMFAVLFAAVAIVVVDRPWLVLVAAIAGFVAGAARLRAEIDKAIAARIERMQLELYTVNQLLALHVRSGAGPIQAVQRVVDRSHGVVVEELDTVLNWVRSGQREPVAFRRAAVLTPCRDAARTYELFAAGTERGSDLGAALLAISEDLRDTRREALRKSAVRRRAAMLGPTIGILAPIMLLFVAAPLPSIVLGNR